jgi:hypothetical protein
MEGCVVGLTDIVGFIDIDGAAVGDQLGADDTVGLRLMEGLCVGESDGDSDGLSVGAVDTLGEDVGILVDKPCSVTSISSVYISILSLLPGLAFSVKLLMYACCFAVVSIGI